MINDINEIEDVCISFCSGSSISHLSDVGFEGEEEKVKDALRDIVTVNLVMEGNGGQCGHLDA